MNPIIESKAYGDGYNDGLEHGKWLGRSEIIEKVRSKFCANIIAFDEIFAEQLSEYLDELKGEQK